MELLTIVIRKNEASGSKTLGSTLAHASDVIAASLRSHRDVAIVVDASSPAGTWTCGLQTAANASRTQAAGARETAHDEARYESTVGGVPDPCGMLLRPGSEGRGSFERLAPTLSVARIAKHC